ncbi:hypothetical protein NDN08_005064 [Rhodosorus marinus]|uniref:Uncharacterized protein n=1 Tax=Rhodosorus marinus TaxID=101924 RepID=A0AAV8V0T4_9RHOD|nr:hypothetical protein NDN08_005064 [Rhodosorus marinus]
MAVIPSRGKDGAFRFSDTPSFRPNLSPKEIFQSGSFGGTYFRPIYSSVVGKRLKDAWKEFPDEWFEGLDIQKQVASPLYDVQVNLYRARTGLSLEEWEGKGWITSYDPYGWVQWYCRFFLGRRTPDDSRQIGRWSAIAGEKGRWKRNLIHKVVLAKEEFDDARVSPVIRQLLQHWAYRLTEDHYDDYAKQVRAGKRTSFIPMPMATIQEEVERKMESEKRKKDEQRTERLERRKRLR